MRFERGRPAAGARFVVRSAPLAPVIEVSRLYKEFGALQALADVSFEVGGNEIFGLLGRNGSGKTTLLRVLTGFRLPTRGTVRVAGIDVVGDPRRAKRRLGYLPEDPQLYGELTVRQLLRFVAAARGLSRDGREAGIAQVNERFGLGPVLDRLCAHCSKGFRGRVALAAAVIHRPAVVLFDEPTAGLDPEQRQRAHDLIRELAAAATVVISSHDLGEIAELCTRVLVLDRGRIAGQGALADLGGLDGVRAVFRDTRERSGERAA